MTKPDFWKEREKATRLSKELSELKEEVLEIEKLKSALKEIEEFPEGKKIEILEKKIQEEFLKIFLSGPYDKGDAILQIFAGAGGRDAQDWVAMLQRMYERYCQQKGYQIKILEQSFGEPGGPEGRIGIKSVTLEIKGKFAFGFLKKETGVHRLVRISPFSPQKLRHTSFAQVQVLPKIESEKELQIEIKPQDIKIETFRASGPGGQHLQKTESAVRITHLPTKITACCQSERSQAMNKKKAMEILYSKLYQLKQKEFQQKIGKMREKVKPSWGNQIRSYVLHPYKLVKDLRTGVETSNVEEVLDGNLDEFIEAESKMTND